jgi:hypothetical protein
MHTPYGILYYTTHPNSRNRGGATNPPFSEIPASLPPDFLPSSVKQPVNLNLIVTYSYIYIQWLQSYVHSQGQLLPFDHSLPHLSNRVDSLFPLLERLEVDLLNCLERVLRVVKFLPSKSARRQAGREVIRPQARMRPG